MHAATGVALDVELERQRRGAWGVTGPAVRAKTCLEAFIVFPVFHAFHRVENLNLRQPSR
jgi:hypothetical protein